MTVILRKSAIGLIMGLMVGVAMTQSANAQAPLSKTDDPVSDDWEFIAAPYLQFANLEGTVTIGQMGIPVDVSFGDIVDNLDFVFAAQLEVRKGRFGFVFNGLYMKLGAEQEIETHGDFLQPILDVGMEEFLMESWAFWRSPTDWGYIDLFAGIRYTDFKMSMTFDKESKLII